jgi:hypothetical protein
MKKNKNKRYNRGYKFSELNREAQLIVVEKYADINVDGEWWEIVYDNFKTVANVLGVTVDLKKTWFQLPPERGSSYTAEVNVLTLIKSLETKAWENIIPLPNFNFLPLTINKRVISLMESRIIDASASVSAANRESEILVQFDSNYNSNACLNYNNIDAQLSTLEEMVTDACGELNHFLIKELEQDYEYRTSKEQITKTFLVNQYRFSKDGRRF